MIVETLVTTVDDRGNLNLAPMGPRVEDQWEYDFESAPQFELRPYRGSQTRKNLEANGWAVIHFSSDADLFARSATRPIPSTEVASLCQPIEAADQSSVDIPLQKSVQNPIQIPVQRLKRCERFFVIRIPEHLRNSPLREAELPIYQADLITEGTVDSPRGFSRAFAAVIETAILATRVKFLDPKTIESALNRLRIPIEKTAGQNSKVAFESLVQFIQDSLVEKVESEANSKNSDKTTGNNVLAPRHG